MNPCLSLCLEGEWAVWNMLEWDGLKYLLLEGRIILKRFLQARVGNGVEWNLTDELQEIWAHVNAVMKPLVLYNFFDKTRHNQLLKNKSDLCSYLTKSGESYNNKRKWNKYSVWYNYMFIILLIIIILLAANFGLKKPSSGQYLQKNLKCCCM